MLQDLDELVLKCRDERARAYIREAVLCFKAGAYRSTIVSTWIAVAFDIADKIHELSLAGDKEAEKFVAEYEAAITNSNFDKLLKVERELLAIARGKYQLISDQEFTDLARLQEDRHRCAHPSRSTISEIFSPSAELARFHIRSAVDSLLQHEPSQGKAALDGIFKLIWSKQFPKSAERAVKILDGSPLKRARPTLVRSLLIALLKASLNQSTEFDQMLRIRSAIKSIKTMHPAHWEDVVRTEATRLFRALSEDDALARGVELLSFDGDIASALLPDQITRLEEFLFHLQDQHLHLCEDALKIPQLKAAAKKAIASLTVEQLLYMSFVSLCDEVRLRVVSGYSKATSFENANKWAKAIVQYSGGFTSDEIRSILHAAATNSELKGSFRLKNVIASLRHANKLPPAEFDELAAATNPEPEFEDDN